MWSNVNVKRIRILLLCVTLALSVTLAHRNGGALLTSRHASEAQCTEQAMADGINHAGSDVVTKVWQFGCRDDWAYVWADVAAGPTSIGVTNVLAWRADLNEWRSVDRAVVCTPAVLPTEIYKQGCFSN